jgi:EmrB/QacA subfamily drug resistance transporter
LAEGMRERVAPPVGAANPWRVLATTAVGSFMTPFDGTVVSVALPRIGQALRLSFVDGLWVQAAYLAVVTAALIPFGRLADRGGRLRWYRFGVVVFAAGSLAAGMASDGNQLIASRCVQALGGAVLSAVSSAIITAAFPPSHRGRALGINVTSVYLGTTLGPVLGGLLTQTLGWRWIFFVNLPVAAATLLLGRGLAEPAAPGRVPGVSAADTVLFAAGIVAALIGLTLGPIWGWHAPVTLAVLLGSGALLVAFLFLETRLRTPLLDVELFGRNRVFAAGNLAALANYVAFTGVAVLTAVFLEVVEGRSARAAGLLLTAQPLCMVALSSTAGRLSDRIGSRWLTTGGMLLIAGGLAALGTLPAHAPLWRLEATLAVTGVGMAAFSSPNTSAVMGSVGRDRLGLASGTLGTMRFLGQALSVTLLGAIATSRLGPGGQRALLTGEAPAGAAADYVSGYHVAMMVGSWIALLGALASLARGSATGSPGPERLRPEPARSDAPAPGTRGEADRSAAAPAVPARLDAG